MTFQLQDIKEYWAIVSMNDRKDTVRILRESPDLTAAEWIDDDDLEWNCIHWVYDQQEPGVYKLTLQPEFAELDEGEPEDTVRELECLQVDSFECLYVL